MDDDLIDDDALSLTRKSLLPGTGFFYPDSLDDDRTEERVRDAVDGAEVVVVADSDADGLGCVALLREAYDAALETAPFESAIERRLGDRSGAVGAVDNDSERDAHEKRDERREREEHERRDPDEQPDSTVALVATGPHSLGESLELVAEYLESRADVYVCDLCPDDVAEIDGSLSDLVERAASVRWFDHHQWDEDVASAVRDAGVDLVVGNSDEECSTDVALRSLDYAFDDQFRDLAAVTRDHDLWLNEDPRSEDLADYAYWVDPEEYVTIVGEHGADLPSAVEEYLAEQRIEKERLIDRAVERAEFETVGPWTVGVTYGRCSQNEVADALRDQGADAAVIVKPAGSASLRGSDDFQRCHEVAALVNGGGHPKASGCKPDIYDDMLDYAHHWTTEGSAARQVILAGFERVAEDAATSDENDGDVDEDDVE